MFKFVVSHSAFTASATHCIRSCAQELLLSLPTSKLWESDLTSQFCCCPLVAIHKSMFDIYGLDVYVRERRDWRPVSQNCAYVIVMLVIRPYFALAPFPASASVK
jgi:hypothetical protein